MSRNEQVMSKILLIEDNPALQKMFCTVLTNGKHEVVAVSTTAEAEAVLNNTYFDLMLCDVHIHSGLKIDWLNSVKAQVGRTVVVAADKALRQRCEDLQFDLFMEKPISNALLLSMINRLMRSNVNQQPAHLGN